MYDLNLAMRIKRTKIKRKTHNKSKKNITFTILYMKKWPNSDSLEAGRSIRDRQSKYGISQSKYGLSHSKFGLSESKFGLSHFGGENTPRLCTNLINTEYVIFNPRRHTLFNLRFEFFSISFIVSGLYYDNNQTKLKRI